MATNEGRQIVRYSISFKQMVIKEVEQGGVVNDIGKKYGIRGSGTISGWIKKFGKYHLLNKIVRIETMNEKDRFKKLEQENTKLKLASADAYMAKDCLEGVIKMANEEYGIDLKKNFGNQSPLSLRDDIK